MLRKSVALIGGMKKLCDVRATVNEKKNKFLLIFIKFLFWLRAHQFVQVLILRLITFDIN